MNHYWSRNQLKFLCIGACFVQALINYACLQVPVNKTVTS